MWWWKGVAWSLVLVLVPMVWGEDCVSENVQIWKFPVGENATISVEGDTDRGCKFVLENDATKSCCYMNSTRQNKIGYNMCLNHHQSEACIHKTRFTVYEPRGRCILQLTNFEASDAGQYYVKFPSESRDNKIKGIVIREKRAEIIRRIDVGQSDTIFIEGDIKEEEGCKFVATFDSKTCCHESNNTRKLCTEIDNSKDCKNYKVTIDGKKCVLYLENFQESDNGLYEAVFPSDPKDNEIVHVIVFVDSLSSSIWLKLLLVIFFVILIGIPLCFYKEKLIRVIANIEIVNRTWITDKITKDKAILDALQSEDRADFIKKLGNKSILKVSDHFQNNIFHKAADEQWTTQMTDIVVTHCKELFPPGGSKFITESGELEPMRRNSIFSAKIPKPYDWTLKWFPSWLLPNHINIDTQNLEGMTPLHIAVGKNHENAVISLLDNEADLNVQDKDGYTALQKAVLFQHHGDNKDPDNINIVRTLLGKNAKLTATGEGQNPLHSAVLKNNLNVISLIINKQEGGPDVALQEVQNEKKEENPQNLLNQKWKQNKNNTNISETPIELAVRLGNTRIVKFFLDECIKYWRHNEGHHVMELISKAAGGGHSKIVDLLLEDKYKLKEAFDPEYRIKGNTCLQTAIRDANPVAVNIILGKMLDRILDVEQAEQIEQAEQAETLTQDILKQEVTNNTKLNINNETEAQIKFRQMSTNKKAEEDNKRDRQILESFKNAENLKRIEFALKRHIQKAKGQDVKTNAQQEQKKVKLSDETIHEHLRHIYASNNTLSRNQIKQILKIMNDTQQKNTL